MQSDDQPSYVAILFGLMTICIVIMLLLAPLDLCASKVVKSSIQTAQAASCLDFWINRYQTLIGSFAAIIATLFAFISLRRQRREDRTKEILAQTLAVRQAAHYVANIVAIWEELSAQNFKKYGVIDSQIDLIVRKTSREIANMSLESAIKKIDGLNNLFENYSLPLELFNDWVMLEHMLTEGLKLSTSVLKHIGDKLDKIKDTSEIEGEVGELIDHWLISWEPFHTQTQNDINEFESKFIEYFTPSRDLETETAK